MKRFSGFKGMSYQDPEGEFVKYSDYVDLQAQNKKLVEDLAEETEFKNNAISDALCRIGEVDDLKAQNKKLMSCLQRLADSYRGLLESDYGAQKNPEPHLKHKCWVEANELLKEVE